ncbi:lipopolysaccharide biosynthesis protein [Limosilactobacillus reuteri]|uniref:lipopolysaccharide biosynthesis protein n=1 Tax=Limosilactobacillus reuteri TaxID=1598 RepID=UPI00235FF23A|nr:lipopolysaccharide biosynthesis protein [Limosilactobacillus reuteri]MDD1401140.1 lipopolysaccharide biosynthesis protein [Limosilactobacillus reuteri]
MRRKIVTGFFWKFGEQISSQLVSFVLSIILARLLTPNDYGVVALVNVFIILANVFVTSGFGTSLIQKENSDDLDFSTIFYLSELTSIFIYIIIFFAAPLIATFYKNSEMVLILRVFALQLPISAFNSIQQAYISKHIMFKKVFVSTTISAILSGLLGIAMAYSGFGVWALIGQYLSNTIIISITLAMQISWRPQLMFSWSAGKPLISFGWKMLATSLLGEFFNQLRSLILGKVYSASDLAYYNRGLRFPELISNNVNNTISSVLFPVLSEYGNNLEKVKNGLRRAIRMSTFILMPLLFGMMVTSKEIILLLLTKKWIAAVPFMQILCMSCVFDTVSNENIQALKAIGRSDILLKLEIVKKPIYLFLLLLGLKISVMAMAETMVIYNVLAVLINMSPNRKLLNYSFTEQIKDIIPALLSSIAMSFIVSFASRLDLAIGLVFFIKVILGVLSYVLIAILFKIRAFKEILTYRTK